MKLKQNITKKQKKTVPKEKVFQSKYKMVGLVWKDSASYSGWQSRYEIDELGEKLEEVITVGFLIKETDKAYIIAHSTDYDNSFCGVLEIPKVCLEKKPIELVGVK